MDLFAYTQIEKYEKLLEPILNDIPRLRGIRYMKEMTPEEDDSEQMRVYNSYCGKDNIYMIHARIGGSLDDEWSNWSNYNGAEIIKKPWFIEKVDDDFDSTYCDIYVKFEGELPNEME